MRNIARKVVERWSAAWRDALASAAAGLSWGLAHQLLGHPQPVFAAVAAVVCLAPGLPGTRGRQAVNMLLGLVTGIVVGEVLLTLPVFNTALRVASITFVAMMAALSFGLAPTIVIQGGVSALLVLALGPITAGPTRLMDALVGTGVAVVFSQILLTPDPVRVIDDAARRVLQLLAQGFDKSARALAERDRAGAEAALSHFFSSRDGLNALLAGINAARSLSRWSLRGRLASGSVAEIARRYDRRAIRLFASTLLFAEALVNALRKGHEPPSWLPGRIDMVASACAALADGGAIVFEPARDPVQGQPVPADWQACVAHLHAIENTLAVLQQSSPADKATVIPSARA